MLDFLIDSVYYRPVARSNLNLLPEISDEVLSDEALALIEHIGQILAEEYVQLTKEEKKKSDVGKEEKK